MTDPVPNQNEPRQGGREMRGRRDQRQGERGGPPKPGDRRQGPRVIQKPTWEPKTKLGRLVNKNKIGTLEEIFYHSIPIKEPEIVEHLLGDKLKDEVMKIKPVQKQTRAGQRTRFKALVAVGDYDGHIGIGIKTSAEVANAIKGALIYAKLSVIPVRFGYWGNKIGEPHTVPGKVTGKCGSVRMRLIPAPRGSGLVAGSVAKRLLHMAGFKDVYSVSRGHTKTTFNFIVATYHAIEITYSYLTPDLWADNDIISHPFVEHYKFLAGPESKTTKNSD